jgi:hypothetical protein
MGLLEIRWPSPQRHASHGEVVDGRRMLGQECVGDDVEGVLEDHNGGQLGGVDQVG